MPLCLLFSQHILPVRKYLIALCVSSNLYGIFCLTTFVLGNMRRDARVMWDQNTGRSRGFGFVSFRNQQVALLWKLKTLVCTQDYC